MQGAEIFKAGYGECSTPKCSSCLSFLSSSCRCTRELLHCDRNSLSELYFMNRCSCYLCFQEGSGLHHPESTPVNSPDSIDITSMSTYTNIHVNRDECSSAVAPIIGNSDGSLSTFPSVAENSYPVIPESCPKIVLGGAPPLPPASCDYSADAPLKPSCFAVQAENADASASQTAWYGGGVTLTQADGSQVPPETTNLDAFGKSWSQHDDACQLAVVPLAQPTSLHGADRPPYSVPAGLYMVAFPESSASMTSQVHTTSLGNVSSRMASAALGHIASPTNHRQCHPAARKPYARLEPVFCDKCKKQMLRQSLKRHIREVHNHMKRPHARPSFAARP